MKPLSREQVRRIDRHAIESLGVPGAVLMENAGRNAAQAACELLGKPAGRSVAIVAGSGNNGGDGFVVARHLANRGATVTTFLICPAEKLTGDTAANLAILGNLGHDVRQVSPGELARLGPSLRQYDLVVDALGGTGIRGALRGEMAEAVEQINAAGRPVLAIDIPTGLDCDSGTAEGPAVRATMTVTFVAAKLGFEAPGARAYTGEVRVADIGISAELLARLAGL